MTVLTRKTTKKRKHNSKKAKILPPAFTGSPAAKIKKTNLHWSI